MSGIQDLVDVQFIDQTNYPEIPSGDDILGIVMNYYWGPSDVLKTYDQASFMEDFPESMPVGVSTVNPDNYHAMALIKKAFASGLPYVEVYRLNNLNGTAKWKFQQWKLTPGDNVNPTLTLVSGGVNKQFERELSDNSLLIDLKYAGYVPQSLLQGYTNLKVGASLSTEDGVKTITITVYGVAGVQEVVLEQFQGWLDVNQTIEGQSFYLPNVINGNSRYIVCAVPDELKDIYFTAPCDLTPVAAEQYPTVEPTFDYANDANDVEYVYEHVFKDIERSQATMITSPFAINTGANIDLDATIRNVAAACKNRVAVHGYPVNKTYDKASILAYRNDLLNDKFSFFVNGREKIQVMGMWVQSNCVGGWIGRTAAVAKEVRLNQLASARTYGAYSGILTKSLEFADVLDLHDNYGIISVYQAYTGPQIFGVRSMHKKQTSYWGKANVIRVTAAILKEIFPLALDAIHTDTASNPVTRSVFETSLNSIITRYAANQNIKPQSNAVCDETINSDVLTNGGEILNIILNIWYIKLTERVQIKVIATDSSVTAEII